MSQQVNDTIDDYLKSLRRRIDELEAALREIADHPHCNPHKAIGTQRGCNQIVYVGPHILDAYSCGCTDGHAHCSEIARKALEK